MPDLKPVAMWVQAVCLSRKIWHDKSQNISIKHSVRSQKNLVSLRVNVSPSPPVQPVKRLIRYVIFPITVPVKWALLWQLPVMRSEEHTSELQSRENLVCRLL